MYPLCEMLERTKPDLYKIVHFVFKNTRMWLKKMQNSLKIKKYAYLGTGYSFLSTHMLQDQFK